MTTVFLAYTGIEPEPATLERHRDEAPVDLLVAYPVLGDFLKNRHRFNVRRWVLDSGAFSVFNSGKTIDLQEYIAACKDTDAELVFGLDVIGDPLATRRNIEAMHEAGVAAVPTFHHGSPWEHLDWCAQFPRLALGGVARMRSAPQKEAWVRECFARVWPKRIHGFGCCAITLCHAIPFDSVDASTWSISALRFGARRGYSGSGDGLKYFSRTRPTDLWPEVRHYLRLGEKLKAKWARELMKLEAA